jgi:ketosteroid isomerase-like protein
VSSLPTQQRSKPIAGRPGDRERGGAAYTEAITADDQSVETLRKLDQAIDTAMSQRDAGTLDTLLADDFVYTHSNGRSQAKQEFIEAILKREGPPRRLLSDIGVEFHGDIVVTRGDLDIEYHDDRPNLYMRYVRVYRYADQRWRAFSHRTVYAVDRKPG